MYKCKPERSSRQALFLVVGLAAFCILIFAVSPFLPSYRSIIQLVGVLALTVSIFIVVRYTIQEMEYTVTGQIFEIHRITGNKVVPLLSVSLASAVAFVDKETFSNDTSFSSVTERVNYNQNLRAKSKVIVFELGGKKTSVEFEPNEVFAEIVREAIKNSKKDEN